MAKHELTPRNHASGLPFGFVVILLVASREQPLLRCSNHIIGRAQYVYVCMYACMHGCLHACSTVHCGTIIVSPMMCTYQSTRKCRLSSDYSQNSPPMKLGRWTFGKKWDSARPSVRIPDR